MKRTILLSIAVFVCIAGSVSADTFGTGENQFDIDFVPISGDSGDLGSWSAGSGYTFSGVNSGDYRMGKYEITNAQFAEFASNSNVYWTGDDVPSNHVSWFEAAQFVNWLNTSHNHQAAYNFNGGTFSLWDASDAWGGTNLYRHKDAYYFLPTEDEWVKAAYWNGTNLQTWATINDTQPVADIDSRYGSSDDGPWAVGSGSQELNGTFDMMGNVWEWSETIYGEASPPTLRSLGGSFGNEVHYLNSSYLHGDAMDYEAYHVGFRVASIVPEPASLLLFGLGGLLIRKR